MPNKLCPNCKKTDDTDFSTCRYCRTSYDATPETLTVKEPGSSMLTKGTIVALVVSAIAFMISHKMHQEAVVAEQAKQIAQYRTSDKPQVLEFYADWCGPCRAYGPIVEEAAKKWKGKVDFSRFNVDQPESRKLAMTFEVRAIPRTIFIDKSGKTVDDVTGGLDANSLDERVAKISEP